MEDDRNYLIFAILRHFEDELASSSLEPDAKEALEGENWSSHFAFCVIPQYVYHAYP